jgi:hypothetical protein
MGESEWVQIIHTETGGIAEVHRSSLGQHYAAGWRLLAPDEVPQPETETEPEPVTRKQAARAAQAKTESGEK